MDWSKLPTDVPVGSASEQTLHFNKHRDATPLKTMAHDIRRSPSPDRMGRSSFSSVRENDSDLAQAFTHSKVSSYYAAESAIDDSPATVPPNARPAMAIEAKQPMTRPHSKLHYVWYPTDSFKGWKEINVRGKLASKSFGDLQVLNMALLSDKEPSEMYEGDTITSVTKPSIFERLPLEIFGTQCHLFSPLPLQQANLPSPLV